MKTVMKYIVCLIPIIFIFGCSWFQNYYSEECENFSKSKNNYLLLQEPYNENFLNAFKIAKFEFGKIDLDTINFDFDAYESKGCYWIEYLPITPTDTVDTLGNLLIYHMMGAIIKIDKNDNTVKHLCITK